MTTGAQSVRYTFSVKNKLKHLSIEGLGVEIDLPAGLTFSKAHVRPAKAMGPWKAQPVVNATSSGTKVTFPFQISLKGRKAFKITLVVKAAMDAQLNSPLTIGAFAYQSATTDGTPYCKNYANDVTVGL